MAKDKILKIIDNQIQKKKKEREKERNQRKVFKSSNYNDYLSTIIMEIRIKYYQLKLILMKLSHI